MGIDKFRPASYESRPASSLSLPTLSSPRRARSSLLMGCGFPPKMKKKERGKGRTGGRRRRADLVNKRTDGAGMDA